jgi:NDP-sugar pyrophosphorylase family protein
LNFRLLKSYLPIDVVIMAGGKGSRLKPLTNDTPKPLLNVGNKPIIEHNIDRILSFGVESFWISINYLGDKIVNYFGQGIEKNININYVKETTPLGTIGAVSKIHDFGHDYVLITNSDILTNLDYEKFYIDFIEKEADLSIIGIPYRVNIPYAVLEKDNDGNLINFKEKPEYTYESNGGIYLIKKTSLNLIPENLFFNATDLIEKLISQNKKVITYPFNGYWLDIGKHDDYNKAQKDIDNINFT